MVSMRQTSPASPPTFAPALPPPCILCIGWSTLHTRPCASRMPPEGGHGCNGNSASGVVEDRTGPADVGAVRDVLVDAHGPMERVDQRHQITPIEDGQGVGEIG